MPLKQLCLNLEGPIDLGCSSSCARIWFIEHFYPLSAAVGIQMPRVPLQPVGHTGLLLCAASVSFPLGCWVRVMHPVPKCPVRKRQALRQLPPSSITACLAPPWSWLSHILVNRPQQEQEALAKSRRRLSWGMHVHHRAVAKWGPCPQLSFTM